MRSDTLGLLASQSKIPAKFLSRALGATNGIVTLESHGPAVVRLNIDALRRRKVKRTDRGHMPTGLKASIKEASECRCSVCRQKFPASRLHIHHVIPLAILGADEPGNWVAACGPCNKHIWSGFDRTALKLYRAERVTSFGVRFIAGRFWPLVNGRVRMETRR